MPKERELLSHGALSSIPTSLKSCSPSYEYPQTPKQAVVEKTTTAGCLGYPHYPQASAVFDPMSLKLETAPTPWQKSLCCCWLKGETKEHHKRDIEHHTYLEEYGLGAPFFWVPCQPNPGETVCPKPMVKNQTGGCTLHLPGI